jgi:hypothetical protein
MRWLPALSQMSLRLQPRVILRRPQTLMLKDLLENRYPFMRQVQLMMLVLN